MPLYEYLAVGEERWTQLNNKAKPEMTAEGEIVGETETILARALIQMLK
jgi:hypothetical protein